MLEVRGVVKRYDGRAVVDQVSFQVQPGEIFALLGPNGAGKTTLIRMITDILKPDAGDVLLDGRPAFESKDKISYLPEERGVYRRAKVIDAVAYYGELKGMSPRDARDATARLLERVELPETATQQVQTLSKGMQQKIQLCTTLIGEPRLLILDEPFTGLDPVNTEMFEQILQERRAAGATVLLSTHQMNKVEELCDRALMIDHGHVVLYGTVREIRRDHAEHAVRVQADGAIPKVEGVREVTAENGATKLMLDDDTTPQAVLQALVARGVAIQSFEVATPPLEDIFRRVVHGGRAGSAAPAAAEPALTGGAR
ncbi:MAG TPA: ATP-binding cassette domain-containing protein [Candidatus Eisenbacteria bacterium]|nr:ATP-binding cassette domain-containing protein [Candidatus Eisenbacteria bacterium]